MTVGGRLRSTACHYPWLIVGVAAFAVRAVVAMAIGVFSDGTLFFDDVTYSAVAFDRAQGQPVNSVLWDNAAPLILPVSWLYEPFGEVKLAAQLYVALLGAATAAITTRLASELLPLRWALLAGLVVAGLPSQILFSSVILKDAAVWLSLSTLALAVATSARRTGRSLAAIGAIVVMVLLVLGHLRPQTLVIACWALPVAAVLGARQQRWRQVCGALVIAVVVPWAGFGYGPAGTSVVAEMHDEAGLLRAQSERAVANQSDVPEDIVDSGLAADLESLPGGLSAMLLEPTPFQAAGGTALNLAKMEVLVWYPVLALALVGLGSIRRRHLSVIAYPVLVGGAIVLAWALVHGNLGTTYRHRGEVIWVMALLAALGAQRLWTARRG